MTLDMLALETLRILVVDDDPKMRHLVEVILRGCGVADLRAEANAYDALAVVETWKPSLLLVDYVMEGLDGIAFTRLVRQRFGSGPDAPAIIIMTGYSELWRLDEAKRAGANEFLVKPFTASALLGRIQRAASGRLTLADCDRMAAGSDPL